MPKFYVLRTNLAYVTEVTEIEAANETEGEALVRDGEGDSIGLVVGDYYSSYSDEETEVWPAMPHNIPFGFVPFTLA